VETGGRVHFCDGGNGQWHLRLWAADVSAENEEITRTVAARAMTVS
jgi:hypothetical protein